LARNAADAVIDVLADRGVRRFYTVPGESFLELIDAVSRHPRLRLISCRHESGAAFMAEADGKLTGVPAVAMATRAVGASNMAIGLHTARQDSTPLLAMLGQVESERLGREAFQEVDLPRLLGEVTLHAETLHRADRASEVAARAYRLATTGRPGPVALAFPADVLAGECPNPVPPLGRTAVVGPDAAAREAIGTLLRQARAPVAILGAGARPARAQVHALVRQYGLGVYTAFRRQDAFPNSDPHYLGHLTLGTPPELLAPLRDADLVVVLGCRLSEITTQSYTLPPPGARVIQVDSDPLALGATVPVEWAVPAPVSGFAAALLDAPGTAIRHDWRAGHSAYLASTVPAGTLHGGPGIHPAAVVAAMRRWLPATAVLTNDAGNFSIFCHRYWRFDHPDTQAAPTSGAMGYGVPAAVAAALARPGQPVVALCGDGGFLMTGQELETAVRSDAPILVVVFANRLYGTIAMHQARQLGRPSGVDIGAVDIAGYARALGADAITVEKATDLDDAFASAVRFERPRVIAVLTDPDVLSPVATLSGLLAAH
jgi:acetolactate synthase I/II/III large subunit